jgi:hypothetical protein
LLFPVRSNALVLVLQKSNDFVEAPNVIATASDAIAVVFLCGAPQLHR